jgi:riboflavin synthase
VFTGIVESLGRVAVVAPLESGRRLTVEARFSGDDLELGESIAVNGACMTVVSWTETMFVFDVSAESLRRTTLASLVVGDAVNLERSMRLSDRIGGHLVSGHIDGTATLASIRAEGESSIYTFRMPAEFAGRTVEKGSIAIDGISLTCFHCGSDRIDVAVIPHTMDVTTLGVRGPGDAVNVELDLIGKYVARLMEPFLERGRGD